MIVFEFKCAHGHTFEEWFASSTEYEAKSSAHLLVCPECGGNHIKKQFSAPRVNSGALAPLGPCGRPCGSTDGVCGMLD